MSALLLPVALGIAMFAALSKKKGGAGGGEGSTESGQIPDPTPDAGKTKIETAQRIAKEGAEILTGSRSEFSDGDANAETKKAIMEKLTGASEGTASGGTLDADALKAAKLAAGQTTLPGPVTKPVQPPAPKPAPAPIARPVNVTPRPLPSGAGAYQPKPVPAPISQFPAGYDRAAAAKNAPAMSANIRAKKYDYNRPALKVWQQQAGIAQDGLYGPQTAATLRSYDKTAPSALFGAGKKAG